MSGRLLIYGATGYTGALIVAEALGAGLRPVLAGRDAAKLARAAARTGLPFRAAAVEHAAGLDALLRDVDVVLNAAGPFPRTTPYLADACLRTRTHYLDVTGEVAVIERLRRRDADARRAGVMLMPAVGFDVVASDCLAAHVAARLPGAVRLHIGIAGLAHMTRGSAKSFVEFGGGGVLVRRGGALRPVPPGSLVRTFDYGDGERASCAVTWCDVACAYYTTGIPDIETYLEETPRLRAALLAVRLAGRVASSSLWQVGAKTLFDLGPEGPTAEARSAAQVVVVADAADARGRRAVSRLRTPEAYTTTARCAVRVAARALDGDVEVGFQTPARVHGSDFVLGVPGTQREDLAA